MLYGLITFLTLSYKVVMGTYKPFANPINVPTSKLIPEYVLIVRIIEQTAPIKRELNIVVYSINKIVKIIWFNEYK